jgi:hypothetical protein
MTLPPKLSTRGGGSVGVSAEIWNQLIDYLKSTRIIANTSVRPTVTSQGTILTAITDSVARTASFAPWTIFLSPVGTPDAQGKYSNYEATVYPGLIGGIIPTKMYDTFTVSGTGSHYLLLDFKYNATDRTVDSAELKFETSAPKPIKAVKNSVPTDGKLLVGVVVDGKAYNLATANVNLGAVEVGRIDREDPEPYESVWDIYYTLRSV